MTQNEIENLKSYMGGLHSALWEVRRESKEWASRQGPLDNLERILEERIAFYARCIAKGSVIDESSYMVV